MRGPISFASSRWPWEISAPPWPSRAEGAPKSPCSPGHHAPSSRRNRPNAFASSRRNRPNAAPLSRPARAEIAPTLRRANAQLARNAPDAHPGARTARATDAPLDVHAAADAAVALLSPLADRVRALSVSAPSIALLVRSTQPNQIFRSFHLNRSVQPSWSYIVERRIFVPHAFGGTAASRGKRNPRGEI